ncbi:MAG TPA: hypothetical protein DEF51_48785 [Myxococcales bacterium]|nr:hypothetical protein [Myxococcales bacterium]
MIAVKRCPCHAYDPSERRRGTTRSRVVWFLVIASARSPSWRRRSISASLGPRGPVCSPAGPLRCEGPGPVGT